MHTGQITIDFFPQKIEAKDYNVTIDGQNFFDHAVKNNLSIYDNNQTIWNGQGDD